MGPGSQRPSARPSCPGPASAAAKGLLLLQRRRWVLGSSRGASDHPGQPWPQGANTSQVSGGAKGRHDRSPRGRAQRTAGRAQTRLPRPRSLATDRVPWTGDLQTFVNINGPFRAAASRVVFTKIRRHRGPEKGAGGWAASLLGQASAQGVGAGAGDRRSGPTSHRL